MNTPICTAPERRTALIDMARSLARRARRARRVGTLRTIRRIGAQLDALNPDAPEAHDVLDAASDALGMEADWLDLVEE